MEEQPRLLSLAPAHVETVTDAVHGKWLFVVKWNVGAMGVTAYYK
jgi:hypothetical protein